MKTQQSRRGSQTEKWPRQVKFGRVSVTVYRRKRGDGSDGFEVANYAEGRRRLESFANEADALDRAGRLAKLISEREVVAASMTNAQAAEYASIVQSLAPFGVTLPVMASTVAECLKVVGGLTDMLAAAKFYATRHKRTTPKRVSEIVAELIAVKKEREASERYVRDLRYRLNQFASDFQRDACNVTTAEVQAWLDGRKLSPQSYTNYRRVLNVFFEFCVSHGYASDNPVASVESIKVKGRDDVTIYTPKEIARLLSAASSEFLPCIALGAFAGLRSAEIERLEWSDIQLAERQIVLSKKKSKTASRRMVPISDNLAAWLAPYAGQEGKVWGGTHWAFYIAQAATADAAGIEWKHNGLRHSFCSYRLADVKSAAQVSLEAGNSPSVVFRHYRELVRPADAVKWFGIAPEVAANVCNLNATAAIG